MIKYIMQILNKNDMVTNTYVYKYHFGQTLYFVYQNCFGKFKVKEVEISAAVYTNMPSYQLTNGWIVLENNLFENKNDAVQKAIYLNQAKKILH